MDQVDIFVTPAGLCSIPVSRGSESYMAHKVAVGVVCSLLLLAMAMRAEAALVVTAPTASTVVPAGDDYATQVLGNAWDMNDAVDIDTEESQFVTNQTFSGSVFSGTTTANGANIYPLFMGYADSINLSRGANFPINTSHYRYFTIKIKASQPGGDTEETRVSFLQDGGSYAEGTYGSEPYSAPLPANQWVILTTDMNGTASPHQWTDFPEVTGLRVDPATTNASGAYADVPFDIDWIRLTAPATAAQKYTVQWTDSGYSGTYNITAMDSGAVGYRLGTGVSGTSYAADMTFLAPGQYSIVVARSDNSASATSGTFRINAPPQIVMTAPSAGGDQSKNFALSVVGNPWGPIDASDFPAGYGVRNFKNVSYSTPSGSFYGRPISDDPGWFFNLGGKTIDTNVYRSVCFTQEVFGTRSVGAGSVARLFWGPTTAELTTSLPIPLDTALSEYCIADISAYAPDPTQPANGGTWTGTKGALRLDPDEFTPPTGCSTAQTCYDVQLNSLVLSPFAHADPGYTFTWTLSDPDNSSATLALSLDPDTTPGNGNEIQILSTTANNGGGSYVWPGSDVISSGTYHVLVTVSDGSNVVNQYAAGVLIVTSDEIFGNGFELTP
jgi:hypothetical protein